MASENLYQNTTCLFFSRWALEETGEKKRTKTSNLSKVRTKMFVCYCFVPPINVDHVMMMLKGIFLPCSCTRITHWCGMVTQQFTVYIVTVQACVGERLIPRTPDLQVYRSRVQSSPVALFPQPRNFTPPCLSSPRGIN